MEIYGHHKRRPQSPWSKLLTRRAHAAKGYGFSGYRGFICKTPLRFSTQEAINVVTTAFMDKVYGSAWRKITLKMTTREYPQQGNFRESAIVGNVRVLFLTK